MYLLFISLQRVQEASAYDVKTFGQFRTLFKGQGKTIKQLAEMWRKIKEGMDLEEELKEEERRRRLVLEEKRRRAREQEVQEAERVEKKEQDEDGNNPDGDSDTSRKITARKPGGRA
jgi:hypothetical protein